MKPDFIVIGAMKCGTSTVCAYFEDHPDVFMVPRCEPNFFSRDENFAKGTDWYESHFAGRGDEKLCGEGSNNYASGLLYPHSATRMAAYHPGLKLIYVVREPITRIASAWIQTRANKGDQIPPTLDRAVQELPDLFIGQSLYWQNLQRYRAVFPDSQIFVGFMEDMEADPQAFFARLCGFLGIEPVARIKRERVNPSQGKKVPSRLYSALNLVPFARTLKKAAPGGLRRYVKDRFLTQKIEKKPEFSPLVLAKLRGQLSADAAALLAFCGKPADFWRI
jgi:hypothetical protein